MSVEEDNPSSCKWNQWSLKSIKIWYWILPSNSHLMNMLWRITKLTLFTYLQKIIVSYFQLKHFILVGLIYVYEWRLYLNECSNYSAYAHSATLIRRSRHFLAALLVHQRSSYAYDSRWDKQNGRVTDKL